MASGVVIVGAGQAGLEAAAALRSQGYGGAVTLIGDEPHAPYQRPPLSKDYLLGKMDAANLSLRGDVFYQNHNIAHIAGETVCAIHRDAREVQAVSGKRVPYDKLILAIGARNRTLPLKGAENLLYLRTRDEADAIRERMANATSAVVIGGGFIGLEVAAALRVQGKSVTVLEAGERLMARAVSPPLSEFFLNLHRSHGSDVRLTASVAEIQSGAVILSDGASGETRIAAEMTVAGIGVRPNQELAAAAGLSVANGIVVDEYLLTSDPDIYAIGDCADHPNRFARDASGGRVRLESVQNAVDQAKCAARGIAGKPAPYTDVPWFWTDQFGVRFQMAGLSAGHDSAVLRGKIESGKFSMFYFKNGRLIAADSVNRVGDHVAARKLLAAGTPITETQAADEGVDLKKL
jgi:3-phenylpropionate/trans-cinnamate dioxygenase ferredoxin reductase component